jgi:hypothetical protein
LFDCIFSITGWEYIRICFLSKQHFHDLNVQYLVIYYQYV